jgi:hypothetical protein
LRWRQQAAQRRTNHVSHFMSDTPSIWKTVTGPSAGLVKKHYVEARKAALERRNKGLEKQLAKVLKSIPSLKEQTKGDKWLDVYHRITEKLQRAPLTINFQADSWFSSENNFPTYAHGYERGGRDGNSRARFQDDPKTNPAIRRADADDKITFNKLVGDQGSSAPVRGLKRAWQGTDRIREQMEFRTASQLITEKGVGGNPDKQFAVSTNKRFDPKTKQIFAALNYGRRPNGSCTYYGDSHLVVKRDFKVNALYYGGDTFYDSKDASQQAAFHVLGTLLAWAKPALLDAIVQSCYFDNRLANTAAPQYLVEAHLFDELPFTNNIEEIVLACDARSVQHENAKIFAAKHGAKLTLIGAAREQKGMLINAPKS